MLREIWRLFVPSATKLALEIRTGIALKHGNEMNGAMSALFALVNLGYVFQN